MFAVLPFDVFYGRRGARGRRVEAGIDDVLSAHAIAGECVQRAHRFGARYWRQGAAGLALAAVVPALGVWLLDWSALAIAVVLFIDLTATWAWDLVKIAAAPRAYWRELAWLRAAEDSARMGRDLRGWRPHWGVLKHAEFTSNSGMLRDLALALGIAGIVTLVMPGIGALAIAGRPTSAGYAHLPEFTWLMLLPIGLRSATALLELHRASKHEPAGGNLQLLPQSLGPMMAVYLTLLAIVFITLKLSDLLSVKIDATVPLVFSVYLAVTILLSAWVAYRMRAMEKSLAWLAAQSPDKLRQKLDSIRRHARPPR